MSDTPRTDALFESLHLPYNNDIPVEITIHAMNLERELAATKRELDAFKSKANRCEDEMNHQAARANNAESDAQSWQQQSDRFSTQLLETFHALEKSEARLRELESLRVSGFKKIPGHVWITVECQTEAVNLAARTLGEAMPRKEGV